MPSATAGAQKVAISGLGHPPSARQVGFPAPTAEVGRLLRVAPQDQPRRLAPVDAVLIGVEQAQIGHQMTLVVVGERLRPGASSATGYSSWGVT